MLKKINSNLIKNKKSKKNIKKQDEDIFIEFRCRNLPTIINSITSDFNGPILNGNRIIENVFPIPPLILIEIEDNEKKKAISFEIKHYFVIFSNSYT